MKDSDGGAGGDSISVTASREECRAGEHRSADAGSDVRYGRTKGGSIFDWHGAEVLLRVRGAHYSLAKGARGEDQWLMSLAEANVADGHIRRARAAGREVHEHRIASINIDKVEGGRLSGDQGREEDEKRNPRH